MQALGFDLWLGSMKEVELQIPASPDLNLSPAQKLGLVPKMKMKAAPVLGLTHCSDRKQVSGQK